MGRGCSKEIEKNIPEEHLSWDSVKVPQEYTCKEVGSVLSKELGVGTKR